MNKKKIFLIVLLLLCVFTVYSDTSIRVGKTAAAIHLNLGKNNEDSIGQIGVGMEYGIINHLSMGLGYVYVDGRYPLQVHGLEMFVKGYILDSIIDLYGFDLYGKAGAQIYSKDGLGLTYTLLSGIEWQSPFKLLIAFEGGVEFENGDWGYLCGGALGVRF